MRITARSQQLRRKNEDGVGRNGEPDALGIASATARHARTVAANSDGVDMNRVTGPRRMIRSQALSVYRWSPGIVTSGPLARDAVSLTMYLPKPGEHALRVHWSLYLSLSTGRVKPAQGGWSTVVVQNPGTATLEGSQAPRHC